MLKRAAVTTTECAAWTARLSRMWENSVTKLWNFELINELWLTMSSQEFEVISRRLSFSNPPFRVSIPNDFWRQLSKEFSLSFNRICNSIAFFCAIKLSKCQNAFDVHCANVTDYSKYIHFHAPFMAMFIDESDCFLFIFVCVHLEGHSKPAQKINLILFQSLAGGKKTQIQSNFHHDRLIEQQSLYCCLLLMIIYNATTKIRRIKRETIKFQGEDENVFIDLPSAD